MQNTDSQPFLWIDLRLQVLVGHSSYEVVDSRKFFSEKLNHDRPLQQFPHLLCRILAHQLN